MRLSKQIIIVVIIIIIIIIIIINLLKLNLPNFGVTRLLNQ